MERIGYRACNFEKSFLKFAHIMKIFTIENFMKINWKKYMIIKFNLVVNNFIVNLQIIF